MARRGENIYKRKDGRWEGRIPNGYDTKGQKKYRSVYAYTYTEVKSKMKESVSEQKGCLEKKSIFMEEAFYIWIQDKQNIWKPSTYSCYVRLAEKQLIPSIGNILIRQFDSACINRFIEEKKNQGLSDSYIRDMTNIILQVMRHYKEVYMYPLIIPSGIPRKLQYSEKKLPARDTIMKLEEYLTLNAEDSTSLGILLCCYTGLRIGELCALQWKDIDTAQGILHIYKTMQRITVYEKNCTASKIIITVPKTKKSIRDIPITPSILSLLKKYQGEGEDYIIRGSKTDYAEPRTVQYRFQSILKQCDIEAFNFHMLRHVFATRCIMLGFDVNTLSELLGHSNVQITLNRYVHSSNERKRFLMEQFQL